MVLHHHSAPSLTNGNSQVAYWRDRLTAGVRSQLRGDYGNAWEVSVAQRISDFIALQHPRAVCDGCICKELDFYSTAQAAQITEALGTTSDFDRRSGQCMRCERIKMVIRAAATPPAAILQIEPG